MSERKMTEAERKEYETLRGKGYALLREAHAIFMTAHDRKDPLTRPCKGEVNP